MKKMQELKMIRGPINSKLTKLSLEEFIHYEKFEKSELASWAYKLMDDNDDVNQFSFKLDYYWFCKEDLKSFKSEIVSLWNEFFSLFDKWHEDYNFRHYLGQLCSLTHNSGFKRELREQLDTSFLKVLENHYTRLLRTKEFPEAFDEILEWYRYRTEYYYDIMGIGSTETELYYLEYIYKNYEKQLEQLKNDSPPTFLMYASFVYHYYTHLPDILDRNYDRFYRYMMLNRIAVLRNIGEYEIMSETIYLFYKGQKAKNKHWRLLLENILDYGTGYGEKPSRLLIIFVLLQIIFFFIFYPYTNSNIILARINKENNFFENCIDVLFFYFTTMLSNLYGNISPSNWLARLLVIFEQIIGFFLQVLLLHYF